MKLHTLVKASFLAFSLLFHLIPNTSQAQSGRKNDVIIKRDSSRIQALITQMTYEKINYRDLSTKDSTKKYISLDQVAKVLLKNGKTINVRDSVLAAPVPTDTVGQYADLNNLPANKFDRDIVMANSDQLRDKYKYYHNRSIEGKTGCIVFTSFAVASLVSGVIISGTGSSPDDKKIGNSLAIAGPVTGGILGLIGFRNYTVHRARANKVKAELERRNQSLSTLSITPAFDPFNKSARLGLRLSF